MATASVKELQARLALTVREGGLAVVTGEVSSGKSTAVRAFTATLEPNRYCVIYLANPTTGITGLYRDLLLALGHEPPYTKPRQVAALRAAFDGPLDLQETISYIKHQLRVAGASQGTLITDDALAHVFDYTKGIPRRINQVCTTALMAARIDQKTVIEESTLRKAIAELEHK